MSKKSHLINFHPAQYSNGKEPFVFYYVINPATEKMERKRIKVGRINNSKERQKYANALIKEINSKLYAGWNPFLEESAAKGFVKLTTAIEIFYNAKSKELRPDSLRSYKSFTDTFLLWMEKKRQTEMFSVNFTRANALEFLDSKYETGQISSNTYNNYVEFFKVVWSWLKDKQYVIENVFASIRKKKQTTKTRVIIQPVKREKIMNYLVDKDPQFAMVCRFVFYTLLRPKEVSYLKPESFNLQNQTIFLPGEATKNGNDRLITIPKELLKELENWDFNGAKVGQYIFATNFVPGKDPVNGRRFAKKWDSMRKILGLKMEEKLYSLRDSGIVQMLNDGISPEEVMKQADHSSLEMTTIYAKHANIGGSIQIKQSSTLF